MTSILDLEMTTF
ncbi:unnamed protein product [Ranitomeya imitator]|uniref:Uncharacterized protein n=1 Tax=Ranitomeya imitator TaxID=111125 RepID=A0ABN9MT42_9NEOB|nr:unnamed protein product [Ranitomeya imitator]